MRAQRAARSVAALLACASLCAAGCRKDAPEERQRALLTPSVSKKQLEEQKRERQLFDDQANLLPSKQKVAGLVLPRGLKPYRSGEDEWAYEGAASYQAFDRYFAQRLAPTTVERVPGMVVFGSALVKDEPLLAPVTVKVERVSGARLTTRVSIKRHTLRRPKLSPAQAEARMEQMRTQPD